MERSSEAVIGPPAAYGVYTSRSGGSKRGTAKIAGVGTVADGCIVAAPDAALRVAAEMVSRSATAVSVPKSLRLLNMVTSITLNTKEGGTSHLNK